MKRALLALVPLLSVLPACGDRQSPTQRTMAEVGRAADAQGAEPGQRFFEVPEFKLLERAGVPVSKETLKGKVWVAAFIFTSCKTSCVTMCAQMNHLQDDFADEPDFVIVATTVDPARDTPERLQKFARAYQAKPDRWLFLTGDRAAIRAFASDGLKIGWQPDEPLVHSTKLILVDRDGWIRGWFDGTDHESVDELRAVARAVLAEKKSP